MINTKSLIKNFTTQVFTICCIVFAISYLPLYSNDDSCDVLFENKMSNYVSKERQPSHHVVTHLI